MTNQLKEEEVTITREDGSQYKTIIKYIEVPQVIKDSYEQAQYNLRSHEPFLSCILNRIRLGYSPQIPTAAISVQRRGIVLYLSDWFTTLSPAERTFVLKHEALHILQGHLPRSMLYYKFLGRTKQVADFLNICQDLAINPDCKSILPPGSQLRPENDKGGTSGCWPELYDLEDGHSFDWYVNKLIKPGMGGNGQGQGDKGQGSEEGDEDGDEDGEEGEGGGRTNSPPESIQDKWERWTRNGKAKSMDMHEIDFDPNKPVEPPSGNEEYDESCKPLSDPEAVARLNEHILSTAQKEFNDTNKGVGNIPGEYSEHLNKILGPKPISWMNKLRNLMNQLRGGKKKPTWKRQNRRGLAFTKGHMKGPKAKVFVVLDTSGSMSTKELQLAMHEIDALARKEEVYEVQVDTRVASFRKRVPGDKWEAYGRGGTDMIPGFDLAKQEKATAIICITDGGIFKWPEIPKVPVIWVSTQLQAKYPYGNVVYLTPQGSWWDLPDDIKGKA